MEEAWRKVRAESRAEDILHILGARGVEVSDSVRERVMACVDLDVLGTWLDRSLTVTSAEGLFVGDGEGSGRAG
ncbi:hypothetical protein [Streptomyces sp. AM6-12]|uniref:hypothetical protein n=1 Tax=Streptomyces sp. AM6-12 TaxID=3345149 RepID=UPI0037B7D2E2